MKRPPYASMARGKFEGIYNQVRLLVKLVVSGRQANGILQSMICIDTARTNRIEELLTVLYKGKQIQIEFIEIEDLSYLAGKILPMEFSNGAPNENSQDESLSKRESLKEGSHRVHKDSNDQENESCVNNENHSSPINKRDVNSPNSKKNQLVVLAEFQTN